MISNPYELALHLGAPDAIAAEIQHIFDADTRSGFIEMWLEQLNRPQFLRDLPDRVCDYLDPPTLREIIAGRLRSMDPFDPDTIRVEAWLKAAQAARSRITVKNIETGEVEAVWHTPEPSRTDAAHTN